MPLIQAGLLDWAMGPVGCKVDKRIRGSLALISKVYHWIPVIDQGDERSLAFILLLETPYQKDFQREAAIITKDGEISAFDFTSAKRGGLVERSEAWLRLPYEIRYALFGMIEEDRFEQIEYDWTSPEAVEIKVATTEHVSAMSATRYVIDFAQNLDLRIKAIMSATG